MLHPGSRQIRLHRFLFEAPGNFLPPVTSNCLLAMRTTVTEVRPLFAHFRCNVGLVRAVDSRIATDTVKDSTFLFNEGDGILRFH